MDQILPSLFLGHGNPMNAIRDTPYSRAWQSIGKRIPRPRAVLAVSAHWYVAASAVTVNAAPRTIHDFGGFPDELYRVRHGARCAFGMRGRFAVLPGMKVRQSSRPSAGSIREPARSTDPRLLRRNSLRRSNPG